MISSTESVSLCLSLGDGETEVDKDFQESSLQEDSQLCSGGKRFY